MWHLSGALEGHGVAGEGLRLSAQSEQVELGAGPVAVVVVKGPVQAGPVRPLSTVGALQGCDQQEGHDDEQESVHGSKYPPSNFTPLVARLTGFDTFPPYSLTC